MSDIGSTYIDAPDSLNLLITSIWPFLAKGTWILRLWLKFTCRPKRVLNHVLKLFWSLFVPYSLWTIFAYLSRRRADIYTKLLSKSSTCFFFRHSNRTFSLNQIHFTIFLNFYRIVLDIYCEHSKDPFSSIPFSVSFSDSSLRLTQFRFCFCKPQHRVYWLQPFLLLTSIFLFANQISNLTERILLPTTPGR